MLPVSAGDVSGRPVSAHGGFPDPAAATGSDEAKRSAFNDAYIARHRRNSLFVALPSTRPEDLKLTARLDEIGRTGAGALRATQ